MFGSICRNGSLGHDAADNVAGWQHVVHWNGVVGQRVQVLDPNQFPTIHQLAGDLGRLADEVNTLLSLAARP